MIAKKKTEYRVTQSALAMLVVVLLLASFVSFYVGMTSVNPVQTVYSTVSENSVSITTYTEVASYITVTQPSYSTVTYLGPDFVQLAGQARSMGFGTTATAISFIDANTNQTFNAPIQDGQYSISISNHANYNVQIHFTGVVGGGQCFAGGLPLYSGFGELQASWSC